MATQGPNSGSTFTNVDNAGGIAWANPSNAASSNDSYATVTSASEVQSDFLVAKGFGFSIPTGATIDGIVVEIEGKASAGSFIAANTLQLTKDGSSVVGDNRNGDDGGDWATSDAYETYGASTELWGTTWTVAEINSANFGVFLELYMAGADDGDVGSVDHFRITVHYTPAAGGGIPRGPFSKPFRGPFGGSIGW